MKSSVSSFKRELTEKQEVNFLIDSCEDFSGLDQLELARYPKVFLFIDSRVFELYQGLVVQLKALHPNVTITRIVASEEAKSIGKYVDYIKTLADGACSRKDLLLAVGGGVILDLAGFVASTYMRGVNLIMIPTTLCGQIDASTAGKTCMNTESSKNLLGTFFLPKISYNNIHFLKSCSAFEHRQGLSEMFKYGLLGSQRLIDKMVKLKDFNDHAAVAEVIKEAIDIRFNIRTYDPLASNLGHTFGHALEKFFDYRVAHGDAISVGTVMALNFALERGIITEEFFNQVVSWMRTLKLNTYVDADTNPHQISKLMSKDKKSHDEMIGLILIKGVAQPLRPENQPFYFVKRQEIELFIENFMADGRFIRKNHWENLTKHEYQI